MALYHAHCKVIGRNSGRSVVAAAAYRSGSCLTEQTFDQETRAVIEQIWDYRRKGGVAFSAILAPEHAPEWVFDREALWNRVNHIEKRKDSQLARDFDIALPIELLSSIPLELSEAQLDSLERRNVVLPCQLSADQNIELLKEIVQTCFVAHGMVADVNLHLDNLNNPHAHVLLTMRELVKSKDKSIDFDLKKNRKWNSRVFLENIRAEIAQITNKHLERYGFVERISHLSFQEQGINLIPGIHVGPAGSKMDISERRQINAAIIRANSQQIMRQPELVLDKLAISKPVFTAEEILKTLRTAVLEGTISNDQHEQSSRTDQLKLTTLEPAQEEQLLQLYELVLASEQLKLINASDLRDRMLFARADRVALEHRADQKIH